MMAPHRSALSLFIFLASLPPLGAQQPAQPTFRYSEGKQGAGELKYYGKIPVLTVAGGPEEIGAQIGTFQGSVVRELQGQIESYVRVRGWQDTYPWILKAGSLLEWNFPTTHRAEFAAAMKTAKVNRELLILANTAFDVVSAFACSTLVVDPQRSETGAPIFGRNLDFPRYRNLHEMTHVTVYQAKGKRAFASVGLPGVFGVISGMNDAGLCVAVNEVLLAKDASAKFNPLGTPKLMLLRRVLEECATIDEAEKLLAAAPRTGMMAVTLCDKNEGAVLEITTKSVIRRRAEEGISTCTNHFRTKELSVGEVCDRLDALDRRRKAAKLGLADVGAALHAANFGELTMQTMIFEPATLRVHLAFGQLPSSAQPRETLDLAPLFVTTRLQRVGP
jgi:isopenicillin-N N-acyltransferase-like protein